MRKVGFKDFHWKKLQMRVVDKFKKKNLLCNWHHTCCPKRVLHGLKTGLHPLVPPEQVSLESDRTAKRDFVAVWNGKKLFYSPIITLPFSSQKHNSVLLLVVLCGTPWRCPYLTRIKKDLFNPFNDSAGSGNKCNDDCYFLNMR